MASMGSSIAISSEIKSPADKFYNMWKTQTYHIPNISDHIQNVDLHEGDWHVDSSVKLWNYTLGNIFVHRGRPNLRLHLGVKDLRASLDLS